VARTAEAEYEAHRASFLSVPPLEPYVTCEACLGPVARFARCYGCSSIFNAGAPEQLAGRIVPMTVALNPSPWYSRLVSYKGMQPGNGIVLAAVAHLFVTFHMPRLVALLGGPVDAYTIVPSTRGVEFEQQALRKVVQVSGLRGKFFQLLRHAKGTAIPRQSYAPKAFPVIESVNAGRIVLLEDTWVSGSKALSAAGALLEAGAESVVILPIARMVEAKGYFTDDHPYFTRMRHPYNIMAWPR
jgi:hypothetical protein